MGIIKKSMLAILFVTAFGTVTFAQCDKPVTLTSSTTSYLDASGAVIRTREETSVITITKTDLTIVPGDEDHKMTGKISFNTCDWKVPFKEGKTVVKSLVSGDGTDKHVTLTIEGKGGKITLTFEAEELAGRKIQVVADKFE